MNPHFLKKISGLSTLLLIAAMATLAPRSSQAQAPAPFTVVALPDIENETDGHSYMLQAQVDWIATNRATWNIAFVAQQGDVVNLPTTDEYTTATNVLFQLFSKAPGLPWGILPGNHDAVDLNNYSAAINPSKFAGQVWYGGASGTGGTSSCSSYQTFTGGSRTYLVINIEYNPSPTVLNWAQSVITGHPGMPTIINTHDYLTASGSLSTIGETIFSGSLTSNSDGLIYGNSQVFLVLCGHIFQNPAQLISYNKEGKPVFQCMADFQDATNINYGNGYLRRYEFDEANSAIHVTTYSPCDTTGTASLTGTANQFDLVMNFNDRLGMIPEPSSLLLTGMAGLGWLTCFRRRRKQ